MQLIRQRSSFDCGVAVVATLAQVSYDAVLDRLITGLSSTGPIHEIALWRSLEDITKSAWSLEYTRKPWPQFAAHQFPGTPTAAVIQREDRSRHYVAVCSALVYDPAFEAPFEECRHPDGAAWVTALFRLKSEAGRTTRST